MKKILLLFACCALLAATATAQPHAVGVRVGQNAEVSFQQEVNQGNMLQIDLGGYAYRGVQATITYAWRSYVNGSSASGTWSSYGGFGLGGGYAPAGRNFDVNLLTGNRSRTTSWYLGDDAYADAVLNGRKNDLYDYGFVGIVGIVGFEYELSRVPLAIAIDYRPMFGVDLGKRIDYTNPSNDGKLGAKLHVPGLWDIALCLRYVF
ncbi:MAG: hypothetical protein Q4D14_02320 [Bacteroidales bacterium]|nr:hypothetical protein [Bacteroidales bacterium]